MSLTWDSFTPENQERLKHLKPYLRFDHIDGSPTFKQMQQVVKRATIRRNFDQVKARPAKPAE